MYIEFQAFVKDEYGTTIAPQDLTSFNEIDWRYSVYPNAPLAGQAIKVIANDKVRINLTNSNYLPSNAEVTIIAKIFFKDISVSKKVTIVN